MLTPPSLPTLSPAALRSSVQMNALDPRSLNDLKNLAANQDPAALRAAAQQLEGVFLQMVLKSMRDTAPMSDLFGSEQSRMFQGMFDQQLALNMAQAGGTGLADVIVRQLSGAQGTGTDALASLEDHAFPLTDVPRLQRTILQHSVGDRALASSGLESSSGAAHPNETDAFFRQFIDAVPALQGLRESIAPRAAEHANAANQLHTTNAATAPAAAANVPQHVREFVERVLPYAQEASRTTGIPAHFMVAQAALETGWGRAVLKNSDGGSSHNLFNIKAGRSWQGQTVSTPTTEYSNGRPHIEQARFRAYDSYADSFRDYARLLTSSPRYEQVLQQRDADGFARSLQQSGYATDPLYAEKLSRIIAGNLLRGALPG